MLPEEDAAFRYYGMGPGENYRDMNLHVTTGIFESTASKEYWPYIMPQEHGNHTGCKWLELAGGLRFEADKVFEINVSRYSTQTLTRAKHMDELQADGKTHVRVDYKDSGLGSNSCGRGLHPDGISLPGDGADVVEGSVQILRPPGVVCMDPLGRNVPLVVYGGPPGGELHRPSQQLLR